MRVTGKRIAILTGLAAFAVSGGLLVCLEAFPFEVRYDVGDLLRILREFEGPNLASNMAGKPRPHNALDDADDREGLADLIAEGTGGEEGATFRVEGDSLIAKATLHRHVEIWKVLRLLRQPSSDSSERR